MSAPLSPVWLALGHAALKHVIPLFLLLLLVSLLVWVLFRAQSRADFDASQFLRDERGQLSLGRLTAFGCFVIHSWAFSVWVVRGVVTSGDTLTYLAWASLLLGLRGLDVYRSTKLGVVPEGLAPPAAKSD